MSEADSSVQVNRRIRKTKQTADKQKRGHAGKPKDIKNKFLKQSDIWTGNEFSTKLVAQLTEIGRINILQQTKQHENVTTPEQKKKVMANLRDYFQVPQESVLNFFFRRESAVPTITVDCIWLADDVTVISPEILSRFAILKSVVHLFERTFQEQLVEYLTQNRRLEVDQSLRLNQQDQVIQCAAAHYLFDNNTIGDIDQIFKQFGNNQIEGIVQTAHGYLDNILEIIEGGNQYQQYVNEMPQPVYDHDSNEIIIGKIY